MYIDALGLVSSAQAFSATAVSTNSVDLSSVTPVRRIGTGEPVGFGMAVIVALAGTTPTFSFDVISATDGALTTSVVVHANYTRLAADLTIGSLHFFPLPPDWPRQRYLGARVNLGGTTPTITATIWLTARDLFSVVPVAYQDAVTIS
jgi:hypothetical protein